MGLAVLFFCGLFAGWRLVHGSAAGFGAPGAGMFYALTGAHAVFAAGGVAFLAALLRQAHAAPLGPVAVAACRLYWHLVGVLWLCILGYFLFYGQA
jgi:heme/copper-type cytochrome/quinol oxidase subunit 3